MGLFFHSVSPPSSSGSSSSFLSLGAGRREGKVGSISVWLKASGCEEASLILAWFSLFLCEASGPYWSGTLLMKDKVVFLSEAQFSWSPLMQGPTQRRWECLHSIWAMAPNLLLVKALLTCYGNNLDGQQLTLLIPCSFRWNHRRGWGLPLCAPSQRQWKLGWG